VQPHTKMDGQTVAQHRASIGGNAAHMGWQIPVESAARRSPSQCGASKWIEV
jgi:hypothetical protein